MFLTQWSNTMRSSFDAERDESEIAANFRNAVANSIANAVVFGAISVCLSWGFGLSIADTAQIALLAMLFKASLVCFSWFTEGKLGRTPWL